MAGQIFRLIGIAIAIGAGVAAYGYFDEMGKEMHADDSRASAEMVQAQAAAHKLEVSEEAEKIVGKKMVSACVTESAGKILEDEGRNADVLGPRAGLACKDELAESDLDDDDKASAVKDGLDKARAQILTNGSAH